MTPAGQYGFEHGGLRIGGTASVVADVTGLVLMMQLFDRLPVKHLLEFDKRKSAGVLAVMIWTCWWKKLPMENSAKFFLGGFRG
ncbi:hypothetical protein C7N83_13835, partial [Neisseria iguanae]